jgi:drug/metabolite transporter (DMT)-like permease
MPRMRPRTLVALAVTIILWASAFAGIRAGLEAYSPGQLALLRFTVASLALGIVALLTRMRLPSLRDVPAMFLLGFVGFAVYHLALNYGEMSVSAGAASLIVASAPVFTALLATAFLGERLLLWGWLGIALSFTGVALVALGSEGGFRFDPRAMLIMVSALSTSIYFVLQKPYFRRYSAFQLTTFAIWAGTLLLSPYLPGLARALPQAPLGATLAAIYLGLFPTALAYVTWNYALSRAPASLVAPFLYLIPVFAIVIAWIWRSEVPVPVSLLGGTLALGGVVLVNTRGKDPKREEQT